MHMKMKRRYIYILIVTLIINYDDQFEYSGSSPLETDDKNLGNIFVPFLQQYGL